MQRSINQIKSFPNVLIGNLPRTRRHQIKIIPEPTLYRTSVALNLFQGLVVVKQVSGSSTPAASRYFMKSFPNAFVGNLPRTRRLPLFTTPVISAGSRPVSSSFRLFRRSQIGFTLIELLVVVLIIDILAAIALPQYQVAVEKARTMRLIPLIKAIEIAQEEYWLANGNYTDDFSNLTLELPAGGTVATEDKQSGALQQFNFTDFSCYLWSNHSNQANSIVCYTPQDIQIEKYFGAQQFICYGKPGIGDKVCKSISGKTTRDGSNASGSNFYRF